MGSIRLGVGTEWLLDGRAFRILRRLEPSQFLVHDLKFNLDQTLTELEILSLYATGRLVFATQAVSTVEIPAVAAPPLVIEDLSPREQQTLELRWQAIEPLTRLGHPPTREEYETCAQTLASEFSPVSVRSLRRYFHSWQRAGGNRLALLTRVARRGGRGRQRAHGIFARYPLLRQRLDTAIADVYLTTARRPIAAVVRRVLEDIQRHNARVSATQAVPVPKGAALQRAISRRIAQLDPWEVDRARWGRRIADRKHQPTSRQQLATRILERVEVDHCLLKVVVGLEAGPLGQPWLTVLIDYYSRMIIGFCLGFEPPSYPVIMEALRQAILPKTYVAARYPTMVHPWPCFGVPEKLVCDRGSDLTSKDLEQAAFQLGMELDFMPPRSPHLKGTVESFFDTLNDLLLSALPGRTFRSWEKRADYQPDEGPLLPYATLVEIIHRHLIDVYAPSKHPTTAKTRLEMWQESALEFPPALPASPEELIVLLSKTTVRTLSARGIELSGMFYMSDELMALRAEIVAQNLPLDKFTIRYNPWDLGALWVLNPIDRRYLQAPAVDSALQGMTEYQWRFLRRTVRERFEDPDRVLSLAAARNAIRDVVDATVHQPKRRRRTRAARMSGEFQTLPPTLPAAAPISPDAGTSSPQVDVDSTLTEPPTGSEPERGTEDPPALNVDDWDVAC